MGTYACRALYETGRGAKAEIGDEINMVPVGGNSAV